ncbi:Histone acetyltransferase type B catalytic subunit [Coccomyxa sp. Obi]|nr:Histone acetyltransferase type B catalytic subunit [Coccomyxa sp. Obi]
MAEDGAPSAKRLKTAQVDANEVITFHFLDAHKEPSEICEASSFPPDMCHQFFGEEEEIKGYEDLAVDIWLSQRSYQALLEVRCSSRTPHADDIEKVLREKFTAGLSVTRSGYLKKLLMTPPLDMESLGKAVLERKLDSGSMSVHRIQLSTADQTVRDLHARMQPLLMFFVDGASAIDTKEPEWDLLLAVHKEGHITTIAGFATIYNFWCFPHRVRIRVSQVLVLPPNQGKGVGRALLEAVYHTADERGALDVTYEDPTDVVQLMREKIELQRALKLEWLVQLAARTAQEISTRGGTSNGQSSEANGTEATTAALTLDQTRAQADLRVSKQQVRKLWEVLLYGQTGWPEAQREAVVEGLVRARLVGSVTSTKRVAEGKRIFDLPGGGFCMTKVPNQSGVGHGAGMPVAMESTEAEGESAEEREAALNEAVSKRMQEIAQLVTWCSDKLGFKF